MNACVNTTGVHLAMCCVRPSRVAGGSCSQLSPAWEEGKLLTVDELQVNLTKRPVICATRLGAFWNSFFWKRKTFFSMSLELGTLNLSSCSKKCSHCSPSLGCGRGMLQAERGVPGRSCLISALAVNSGLRLKLTMLCQCKFYPRCCLGVVWSCSFQALEGRQVW